ncbi:MAG TPA: hypothetical protein VEC01_05725 [Noviherbaspirillum sp.]|uniref:hypothetical protein n=1 Tax=Noviherbaspirillum sp. TaxID=1926288 RepID=UPI002D2FF16F|nr:hypothetical protein [Noviherbaspirillum sp.]HYD94805.1 hypothetical protein [Noviherbaspirillum sp.]
MDNVKPPAKRLDKTEADVKSVDGRSGQSNKSSHNNKSHVKSGSNSGAGGGKKQERHQGH